MYGALWRILPGPRWLRVIEVVVLALAVIAVLFQYVFPAIEPYLSLPGSESSVG